MTEGHAGQRFGQRRPDCLPSAQGEEPQCGQRTWRWRNLSAQRITPPTAEPYTVRKCRMSSVWPEFTDIRKRSRRDVGGRHPGEAHPTSASAVLLGPRRRWHGRRQRPLHGRWCERFCDGNRERRGPWEFGNGSVRTGGSNIAVGNLAWPSDRANRGCAPELRARVRPVIVSPPLRERQDARDPTTTPTMPHASPLRSVSVPRSERSAA